MNGSLTIYTSFSIHVSSIRSVTLVRSDFFSAAQTLLSFSCVNCMKGSHGRNGLRLFSFRKKTSRPFFYREVFSGDPEIQGHQPLNCWQSIKFQSPKVGMEIVGLKEKPSGSMYGIFTYIYHKSQLNVGKYTIHGSYKEHNL